MKINNKQKKSSFRRKDKNLRKKTLKKYHKKSFAKGKKQKGGIELSHVDQTTQQINITSSVNSDLKKKQRGGKRRKEIQNMFLKANKFANKYIETNIERVSSGGKQKLDFISFKNIFNSKSEETIKKEQDYKENKEEEDNKESEEEKEDNKESEEEKEDNKESEEEKEDNKESEEEKENEEPEEKPNKLSRFSKFISRSKAKEDPIEPDLSEHDSATDDKIMINKEKDKYVWIRVNIPRDKDVLVQSDTSGTLEETLKTFKESPAE